MTRTIGAVIARCRAGGSTSSKPVHARHLVIDHQTVVGRGPTGLQQRRAVGERPHAEPFRLQKEAQGGQDIGIVIDDEDRR